MKKHLWIIMLLLLLLLTGCGQGDKVTSLTEEGLAYFNGTEFFNNYETRCNQFLNSLYDTPEQIDLYELLYCGTDVQETLPVEEEIAAYEKVSGREITEAFYEVPYDCDKLSTANIDEFLYKYLGLTLAETAQVGLEPYIYLEEYDAYYHFHSDTNYCMQVVFDKGECQGDLIRLYYDDTFHNEGSKVVTLRQVEDGYQFVSNQLV